MIKIQCKKGQTGGMYKALGFYKEITLNVALKTFMIFPEGQISRGMWVVLQYQKINSYLLRLFTPKGTLWTSRQVILLLQHLGEWKYQSSAAWSTMESKL